MKSSKAADSTRDPSAAAPSAADAAKQSTPARRNRRRRDRPPVVVRGSLALPPEIPAWERELILPLALEVIDGCLLTHEKKNRND